MLLEIKYRKTHRAKLQIDSNVWDQIYNPNKNYWQILLLDIWGGFAHSVMDLDIALHGSQHT